MRSIQHILTRQQKPLNIIYVSSYIPRKCGIATYTKDLTNAINLMNSHSLAEIMVITPSYEHEALDYPWEAKYKISQDDPSDYVNAAQYVNLSHADLVVLEHEFGLFGGEAGEYIVHFAEVLNKPLVTTFHTVPQEHIGKMAKVLRRLSAKSRVVTVMMETVAKKLVSNYHIPRNKVVVIPHGVPDLPFNSTKAYKAKRRLGGRIVLGNINLLHRNKGIEYALEAVALIVRHHPELLYVCIGQSHPGVLRQEGEAYRNFLKKRVRELGLKKNVLFVNKYLSLKDLTEWLKTIDIYITPYLDPQQITSGALAYAVGAGKACISTPYLYAKEVLANDRGMLVPWRDPQALSEAISELLNNPAKKREMEKLAYQYGRLMTWPHVGNQHLNLFRTILTRTPVRTPAPRDRHGDSLLPSFQH
ncbi:MAG: glycosyltransferase family 4 protein [bacterium]